MYSIIRINKIKNRQQLQAAVAHNFRTVNVQNADPNKLNLNRNLIKATKNYGEIISRLENRFSKLNIKPRKDSVQAVEMLLTASPEFFQKDDFNMEEWISKNIEFIKEEMPLENILSVVVHLDETTPHIHLLFTPITKDNRLSCKDLYGGKAKLSELQTRYNLKMKPFGLKRGKESSAAKHTTVKEFYSLINTLKNLKADELDEIAELIENYDNEHKNFKNLLYSLSLEIEDELKNNIKNSLKSKLKS